MCRLLAFASSETTTIQALLTPQEFETYRQLSTLHGDGWGAAWETGDAPVRHVNSTQRAVDDAQFLNVTSGEPSSAGIVHLRWATTGFPVNLDNTHPFEDGEWHFAHNGAITNSEKLHAHLSPIRRAALRGTTDSEVYFQLIMDRLDAHGDIVRAVREAIATVREVCGLGSLNCLLLGDGRMLAVQAIDATPAPTTSLIESVGGVENLPEGHDDHYYQLRMRVDDHAVIVASTGLGEDGWEPLGEDAIVDADLAAGVVRVYGLADGALQRTLNLSAGTAVA